MTHSIQPGPAPRGAWWALRRLLPMAALSLIAGCGGGGGGNPAEGPPALVEGPQPASVKAGEAARFSVQAVGAGLGYQWRRDGSDVPGAVQPGYTLPAAEAADHGSQWSVHVSNAGGSVTSAAVRLSVLAITAAPAAQTVAAGLPATFSVQATGDGLAYQWQRDGVDMPGAVQPSLTLPAVQAADDGSRWTVRVGNAAGMLTSAEARLSVLPAPAASLQRVAGWLSSPGFADGPGSDARFDRPNAVARDAAGALWVSDQSGLALRRVGADGHVVTVAGRSSPRFASLVDEQGKAVYFGPLAVAPDGLAYAIDFKGMLREISPAGEIKTLWRGEWGFADGPLATARFGTLKAIAADGQGRLHVADADHCAIRTIDRGTGTVSTRARTLPCPNANDSLSLRDMTALALHASGDLVAVAGQRVLRVSAAGTVSLAYEVTVPMLALGTTLAGDGDGNVYATVMDTRAQQRPLVIRLGADGRMAAVDVSAPIGASRLFTVADGGALLYFDSDGVLWSAAASPAAPRVLAGREAAPAGRAVTGPFAVDAAGVLVAATGPVSGQQLMRVAADGQAALIDFSLPAHLRLTAMAAGSDGAVYLLARRQESGFVITGSIEYAPGLVYRMSAAGQVQPLAGSDGYAAAADGPGTAAQFEYPRGLAIDGAGNLYLIDRQWSTASTRIRRIAPDGTVSTRPGEGPWWGDEFLAVDGSGHLYTAGRSDPRVRRLTPAGVLTVIFGDTLAAQPDGPTGVTGLAVEPDGTLIVAHNDGLIRRVSPAGQVTVLAGTQGVHGVRLGLLPAAVYAPTDLMLDAAGRLFFRSEQAVLTLPARPVAP
ncbi:MAG: hypothetical protein QM750_23245 [Rubrivivax sp.]